MSVIFDRLFKTNADVKKQAETVSDDDVVTNIYGYKDGKELKERFKFTHNFLKNKLIVPMALWFGKHFKKQLYKPIPNLDYYVNLKIFNKAIDRGLDDWENIFYKTTQDTNKITLEEYKAKFKNGVPERVISVMRDVFNNVLTSDTAYHELFNFIMFNYVLMMNETYGEHGRHLLFSSRQMNDAAFFMVMKEIKPKIVPMFGVKIDNQIKKFNEVKEEVNKRVKYE